MNRIALSSVMLAALMTTTTLLAENADITCLKSIKESLQDPFHRFKSSWNFNNDTQGFICSFSGIECWHPNENRVMNIRLNNMGLKGRFPHGLNKCTTLTGLDLSSNDLSGSIPSNISTFLPYITLLDLSSNRFSGEIPPNFGNCSFLNRLNLDHNRLSGNIPPEIRLCRRLKRFSVADNFLTGPLPDFVTANFSRDSYADNPELCGYPLEPCPGSQPEFMLFFKQGFMVGFVGFAVSVMTICMSSTVQSTIALLHLIKGKDSQKKIASMASTSDKEKQRQAALKVQSSSANSAKGLLASKNALYKSSQSLRWQMMADMHQFNLCLTGTGELR